MTVYSIDPATGYLHRDGALISIRHIGEAARLCEHVEARKSGRPVKR